jgi:hypothetical protein
VSEEVGDGIPPEVRALIAGLDSVVQLETLLLLHRDPRREWTADEVAKELRINPTAAADQMNILCERGLLTCTRGNGVSYRDAPHSPKMAAAVDALEKTYAERRVTVITLIFSKPTDPLRSFADAFQIRRNPPGG